MEINIGDVCIITQADKKKIVTVLDKYSSYMPNGDKEVKCFEGTTGQATILFTENMVLQVLKGPLKEALYGK